MPNWLARIRQQINAYKERKFLERHNVSTWEEYHHVYDPDINKQFNSVDTRYHGYRYTVLIRANLKDYGFHGVDVDLDQYEQFKSWCKDNCVGKFRIDSATLKSDLNTIIVASTYVTRLSGAMDYFIIAFKDPNDHMLFELVWQ